MNLKLKYPQQYKKQHKNRQNKINKYRVSGVISMKSRTYVSLNCVQNVILPNRFISFLRKILRKFFKKRHIKCWLTVQPNKLITSKAKNSRMGKGVGTINRVGFYTTKKPFLVLSNISSKRCRYLARYLQARLSVNIQTTLIKL